MSKKLRYELRWCMINSTYFTRMTTITSFPSSLAKSFRYTIFHKPLGDMQCKLSVTGGTV